MIKRISAFALLGILLVVSLPSRAGDSDIALPAGFGQTTFNTLVEELGTAVAYNSVAPAESMGITGFDIGVVIGGVELDSTVWSQVVSDGSAPSSLIVPKLIVRKGLPFGVDLGVSYVSVPGSNVTIMGGEIRKALLEGSTVMPAISLSLHTASLSGVDDLDISTYGFDVGISKGFAMFTPYASVGQVWFDGSENTTLLTLQDYNESTTRSSVGVKIGFMPIMSLTLQADMAKTNSYNMKLSLDF
ncbi:MAG: hypothetical protein L3J89_03295 [Gammaproteobacteria bacterium]|nr:hypothetical protein [Gammaproteobacteria bacterium]